MRFSVLIPVFNGEKYISACISSVLNQSFQDFEILICDDGSTDRTRDILNEFSKKDSRIKLIFHSRNQTAMIARNDLIRASSGEYLTFIDADDFIDSCFLKTGHEILLKDPVEILTFPLHGADRSGDLNVRLEGKEVFDYHMFHSATPWTSCSRFYKRTLLIKSILPDAEVPCSNDTLISFPAFFFAQTARFEKKNAMYHYNLGCGGWGRKTYSKEKFKTFCRGFALAYQILRKFFIEKQAEPRILERLTSIFSCNMLFDIMNQNRVENTSRKEAMQIFIEDRSKEELAEILAEQRMLSAETPIKDALAVWFWFLKIVFIRWKTRIKGIISR